jgi:hypothetical protein
MIKVLPRRRKTKLDHERNTMIGVNKSVTIRISHLLGDISHIEMQTEQRVVRDILAIAFRDFKLIDSYKHHFQALNHALLRR